MDDDNSFFQPENRTIDCSSLHITEGRLRNRDCVIFIRSNYLFVSRLYSVNLKKYTKEERLI